VKVNNLDKSIAKDLTASDIEFGGCFHRTKTLMMRVKPTGFLLNSNVINENINKNNIFAVNLTTGSLYCFAGTDPVVKVDAEINYTTK
jgi:hypothetical protein